MRRLETVKLLQRRREWAMLVDRYDEAGRSLVALLRRHSDLNADQQSILQEGIRLMQTFEMQADRAAEDATGEPDVPWMNNQVSRYFLKFTGTRPAW